MSLKLIISVLCFVFLTYTMSLQFSMRMVFVKWILSVTTRNLKLSKMLSSRTKFILGKVAKGDISNSYVLIGWHDNDAF